MTGDDSNLEAAREFYRWQAVWQSKPLPWHVRVGTRHESCRCNYCRQRWHEQRRSGVSNPPWRIGVEPDFASSSMTASLYLSTEDYAELVDWAGKGHTPA